MKTYTFLISIVFILFGEINELHSQVVYEWSEVYDGGGIDHALLMNDDASNYRYVTGTTETIDGVRLYIRKYNYTGTRQWDRTGNVSLPGKVLFIKKDKNLNTFLVCENLSISGYSTMKFDTQAKLKWKKDFTERPVGMEIDSRGNVLTGGQATGGFFARCYRNSDGKIKWARSDSQGRNAAAMDIDRDGNVVVGGVNGAAPGFSSNDDMRIVKFGISSYSFIWAKNYNGPDDARDNVHLLQMDEDDNVYLSGEIDAFGSMGANICVAKFNPSGNFIWSHFITTAGGAVSAKDYFLKMDPSKNPVLVGRKVDFFNISPVNITSRIFVAKLDRHTGAEIFFSFPDDLTVDNQDIDETPVCCTIDEHGHVYIGGYGNQASSFFTDRRWLITKVEGTIGYNPWIQVGMVPGNQSQVNDIFISVHGSVYIAATEDNGTPDFYIEKLIQHDGLLREAAPVNDIPEIKIASLSIYPNPSSDKFTLVMPESSQPADIFVFDLSAKLVREYKSVSSSFEFGDDLTSGMYFINIFNGSEKRTLKVIKQ